MADLVGPALVAAMRPGARKQQLAAAAGMLIVGWAARAGLTAWCDRRGIAPPLRSPLLPIVSVPYTPLTLPLWRLAFRMPRWSGPNVKVVTRRLDVDPNIRVRVTTPRAPLRGRARPRPAVIWLHSGGMISGSPQFEGPTAGALARKVDAVVVAPDYRLAPEDPFPAALDDCVDTVKWVIDHAEQIGVDPTRIAVAGASAGGGLAVNTAQRCGDEGIRICAQALLYPMLDDQTPVRPGSDGVAWSISSNRFAWTAYLGLRPEPVHARPYSAASRRDDVTDSPPTWIAVGDLDILCAESGAYVHRLREARVACEFILVPGMYHAADLLVPWARPVRELLSSLAEYLRCHLAAPEHQ